MLTTIVLWALVLIALFFVFVFALRLAFLLFLNWLANAFLGGVGEQALAQQPDHLHLTPAADYEWSNEAGMDAIADPLMERGFTEAGTYEIDAMPGAYVRFLVSPTVHLCCAIYEHPKIGVWFDLYSRFEDERGVTYTTATAKGLDRQPGSITVNAPGATSVQLYDRILKERPKVKMVEITAANVVSQFEAAYAREIAWRKKKGISGAEVARVQQATEAEGAA